MSLNFHIVFAILLFLGTLAYAGFVGYMMYLVVLALHKYVGG